MLQVGLTGGIASGKSTVADLFAAHGVAIADADIVSRECVAPGSAGLDQVAHRFGSAILHQDGSLNRNALRQRIFSDPTAKRDLEAILHPRIRAAMDRLVDGFRQRAAPYCLRVIPLLFETGQTQSVDRVLLVDCPEQVQIQRIVQRDQCSREQAQAIIQAQAPRAQRLQGADDIIDNSTGRQTLNEEVARLHRQYLTLAKAGSDSTE